MESSDEADADFISRASTVSPVRAKPDLLGEGLPVVYRTPKPARDLVELRVKSFGKAAGNTLETALVI
jgi:hypothetical protein